MPRARTSERQPNEALSLHALLRCGQAWDHSQSISALFFNFVLSAEARTLVVAHGRWLGVASATQRQEVIFDDLLHFDVMLHVGGQEKPSVAAQAQEACTHVMWAGLESFVEYFSVEPQLFSGGRGMHQ